MADGQFQCLPRISDTRIPVYEGGFRAVFFRAVLSGSFNPTLLDLGAGGRGRGHSRDRFDRDNEGELSCKCDRNGNSAETPCFIATLIRRNSPAMHGALRPGDSTDRTEREIPLDFAMARPLRKSAYYLEDRLGKLAKKAGA